MHDVLAAAASGTLPSWAQAGPARRAHMARVADLLGDWAGARGLADAEVLRWRAAGHLHDALRDAPYDELRARVPIVSRSLPGPLLHGPAAAELLRVDGVLDGELLIAVAYHTVGAAELNVLGRALYAADFLEPGRDFLNDWRAELRARAPEELDRVVFEVVQARLRHLVERGMRLLPRTGDFWNALVAEQS